MNVLKSKSDGFKIRRQKLRTLSRSLVTRSPELTKSLKHAFHPLAFLKCVSQQLTVLFLHKVNNIRLSINKLAETALFLQGLHFNLICGGLSHDVICHILSYNRIKIDKQALHSEVKLRKDAVFLQR